MGFIKEERLFWCVLGLGNLCWLVDDSGGTGDIWESVRAWWQVLRVRLRLRRAGVMVHDPQGDTEALAGSWQHF